MYVSLPQYSTTSEEGDEAKAPVPGNVPFTVVVGVLPNETLVKLDCI
jgi:hypothetical protein